MSAPRTVPARPARTRPGRALVTALGATALTLALSSCSVLEGFTGGDDEPTAAATTTTTTDAYYQSQFTRDGTFQSHIELDKVDFVYTLYPTKSTPRTNEWYPAGSKYFSFTFQAYDLARGLRDPFETKRKVYLSTVSVTTQTVRSDGGPAEQPYSLQVNAQTVTLDPEPLKLDPYGMLITSPKGAFELRNQEIAGSAPATIGIDMTLSAKVFIETSPGSQRFVEQTITQQVPIAIFTSDDATVATSIPVDAN